MVVYSFSQLNLYHQCPKKYQYHYLDGLEKAFETSYDLLLGQSVHHTLEWLYQELNIFKHPSEVDVLASFQWFRDALLNQYRDTLLNKNNQTPEDYLRRGESYLKSYYRQHHPFDEGKVVATELMLNFDLQKEKLNQNWVIKFRGVIDRLQKEGSTFTIHDYKTNKHLPSEDKQEYRDQLTLYAVWIQQKYGKYLSSIKAKLHYLHFDCIDEREINETLLETVLEKYRGMISQIENSRFDYNMGVTHAFPAVANTYCQYCEYQHLCPLWQHLGYGEDILDAWNLWNTTIKKLVDRYAELSARITQETKEKETLKDLLITYAEKGWFQQLFGDEAKIWISKSSTYTAKDKIQLQSILDELGLLEDAIDIPHYKLSSLVKEKKLTPDQISSLLDQKPSWRLTISKNKDEKETNES